MKAIIIGASSGIGAALAKIMAAEGYELGLTARRTEKLVDLAAQISTKTYLQTMDVTKTEAARAVFLELIDQMNGVDVVIINAGVGEITTRWEKELNIINTNVTGFTAITNAAFYHFQSQQQKGHIVGISSLAALRGGSRIPAYHASKAFITSYMQGLRYRAIRKKLDISVTDIRPGFVKTEMTDKNDFMIWAATADKAATQIFSAIKRKKKVAYITKRWSIVAFIMRVLPDFIYSKIT
ncbi:MAG: SDR family NAD(P)-dependent oxidoreductase [Chitinophagales bacterium]